MSIQKNMMAALLFAAVGLQGCSSDPEDPKTSSVAKPGKEVMNGSVNSSAVKTLGAPSEAAQGTQYVIKPPANDPAYQAGPGVGGGH
jgi:hypothetical protein